MLFSMSAIALPRSFGLLSSVAVVVWTSAINSIIRCISSCLVWSHTAPTRSVCKRRTLKARCSWSSSSGAGLHALVNIHRGSIASSPKICWTSSLTSLSIFMSYLCMIMNASSSISSGTSSASCMLSFVQMNSDSASSIFFMAMPAVFSVVLKCS